MPSTHTQPEENTTCACLNGCHTTAAEPITPQQTITNLLNIISSITRTMPDGRIEPYCGGNCSMIADLRDVADFSAMAQARHYNLFGPAYSIANTRDALRDRIADICCGACGRFVGDEDDMLAIPELSNVLPAIQATWPNLPDWVWFPHNIKHFHTVDSITDFIFGALQG